MTDAKSTLLRRLLIILDLCLTILSFAIAANIFILFGGSQSAALDNAWLLVLVAPAVPMALYHFGCYRRFKHSSVTSFAFRVLRGLLFAAAAFLLITFALEISWLERDLLIGFFVLNLLSVIGMRQFLVWWYFNKSVEKESNYRKVLIIGTGDRAQRLRREILSDSEFGISIVGHLDISQADQNTTGYTPPADMNVLGDVASISSILREHVVEEVILAMPRSLMNDVAMIAAACEEEGVQFLVMSDLYDLHASRISLTRMGTIPVLRFEPVALDTNKLVTKRLFDITLTLLAMPVLLPVFAIIAAAIKLDDGGPIFFVQERVGFHKRRFPMMKFRTMVVDAEARMKEIEHLNEAEGPIFKMKNDPRVTRVGAFLRKTSLDEIPQLLNVLRGHMSLIGPRPMSLRDVELFDQGIQRKRFSVRPGLTCIWQVSGRSDLPFEKWLELDLEYIDNWSLWLDIKILFLTIPAVMKGSGAV